MAARPADLPSMPTPCPSSAPLLGGCKARPVMSITWRRCQTAARVGGGRLRLGGGGGVASPASETREAIEMLTGEMARLRIDDRIREADAERLARSTRAGRVGEARSGDVRQFTAVLAAAVLLAIQTLSVQPAVTDGPSSGHRGPLASYVPRGMRPSPAGSRTVTRLPRPLFEVTRGSRWPPDRPARAARSGGSSSRSTAPLPGTAGCFRPSGTRAVLLRRRRRRTATPWPLARGP